MTLRVPVTGQSDLFLSPLSLPGRGTIIKEGLYRNIEVELLGDVTWNAREGRWEALANVLGALCIIEVKVTAEVS